MESTPVAFVLLSRECIVFTLYTPLGYSISMKKIVHRLHRINGQINSVANQIEHEEDCDKVIMQLTAIRGGINAVLEAYVDTQFEKCTVTDSQRIRNLLRTLLSRQN